jgi:hypothetical protein
LMRGGSKDPSRIDSSACLRPPGTGDPTIDVAMRRS